MLDARRPDPGYLRRALSMQLANWFDAKYITPKQADRFIQNLTLLASTTGESVSNTLHGLVEDMQLILRQPIR